MAVGEALQGPGSLLKQEFTNVRSVQELVITVKASVLLGSYSPQEMSGPDRQDQESEFIIREGPQGHAGRAPESPGPAGRE